MFYSLIQSTRELLSLLLMYGISVTIAGAIKAWVAKRFGDYTADYAGFLTLDPLVHVDLIGVLMLLLTGFGWGREVPVNMYNVQTPYRDLKILFIYYVQTILHILFASLVMLCLAGIVVMGQLHMSKMAVDVLGEICKAGIGINIFLAMLRFIQSSIDLLFVHVIEQDPSSVVYMHLISLLATFLLLWFIGKEMQLFFIHISSALAFLMLRCIA